MQIISYIIFLVALILLLDVYLFRFYDAFAEHYSLFIRSRASQSCEEVDCLIYIGKPLLEQLVSLCSGDADSEFRENCPEAARQLIEKQWLDWDLYLRGWKWELVLKELHADLPDREDYLVLFAAVQDEGDAASRAIAELQANVSLIHANFTGSIKRPNLEVGEEIPSVCKVSEIQQQLSTFQDNLNRTKAQLQRFEKSVRDMDISTVAFVGDGGNDPSKHQCHLRRSVEAIVLEGRAGVAHATWLVSSIEKLSMVTERLRHLLAELQHFLACVPVVLKHRMQHYEALGLESSANVRTIWKACREITRLLHPEKDNTGAAPADYLKIRHSCDALLDATHRKDESEVATAQDLFNKLHSQLAKWGHQFASYPWHDDWMSREEFIRAQLLEAPAVVRLKQLCDSLE